MMDSAQVVRNAKDYEYQSLCQNCVWQIRPTMLTGYCLWSLTCDRCGRVSDLAITRRAK